MQREIVPTSPQYKGADKPQLKQPKEKYRLGLWELLLILLFSLIGGISGSIIINNQITLKDTLAKEIVYLAEKRDGQEELMKTAIEKIKPSVVGLYNENFIGSGLALTSDGWIVTTIADINKEQTKIKTADNKEFTIDQIIIDNYSGTTFIKVSTLNLTPAQFANAEKINLGDKAAGVFNSQYSGERVFISYLENIAYHEADTFNTQNYPYNYLFNNTFKQEYSGAPVINDRGEVLALYLSEGKALPHRYFSQVLSSVISDQNISRPIFNIDYALLTDGGAEIKAISTKNTGLLIGDVIKKVDGQEINKIYNLNHVLEGYKTGDTKTFTIIRGENEQELELVL
ncbi:MAG: S1C family serine protease [Patescibacteria group bacterium]|jgi:S1-C subfamily serine protease